MDLETLQHRLNLALARIDVLEKQLAARDELIKQLRIENELQAFEIKRLRQELFGRRSERVKDVGPLLPGIDASPANADSKPTPPAPEPPEPMPAKRRRKTVRVNPSNYKEITHESYPDQRHCRACGHLMKSIGTTQSTRVERTPAHYEKHCFVRHKLGRQHCKGARVSLPNRRKSLQSQARGLLDHHSQSTSR